MATNPRDIGDLTLMIANEVKTQRAGAGFTQAELSTKARIERPTLSKIERGVVAIDMEQLARLAAAFKMTPEKFVASARQNARERAQRERDYLPDGSLNPEEARGVEVSEDVVAEIAAQRKVRSKGRRISTATT